MSGRAATTTVIAGRYALSVGMPGTNPPKGWVWTSIYDLSELGTGHTPSRKHPEYWGGSIPWIGIKDAANHHGEVIFETLQHTNELGLANSAARLLPKNTVCLSRTASIGYVVVMGRDMATSQDFVTWTCNEGLDPHFLKFALMAEGDDVRRFGKGTTHTTIYFPEVKAFHICIPPANEQRRIVEKIEACMQRVEYAENAIKETGATGFSGKFKSLRQSILAKAFRGELVPRDPTDEPASVLLERIRAEREAAAASRPKRRRRKKGA